LQHRSSLRMAVLLVDIRREPQESDMQALRVQLALLILNLFIQL